MRLGGEPAEGMLLFMMDVDGLKQINDSFGLLAPRAKAYRQRS